MPARILSIGTALPATRLPQEHVRDLFAAQPGVDRLTRRLIHAAFDAAAIDSRRTVLAALAPEGGALAPGGGGVKGRRPNKKDKLRAAQAASNWPRAAPSPRKNWPMPGTPWWRRRAP